MKKTTIKAAKLSASTLKAAAKIVKKTAASRKKTVAAPAIKTGQAKPVVTVITAAIDVGFGNTLYIRGDGAGLSWDAGVPLECVKGDRWSIVLPETAKPIACKFLINDLTWSVGPDYVVEPGKKATIAPAF